MRRIGNPFRALMRLDDRFLGRWLYNRQPVPLRVEIAGIVVAIVLVTLLAVISGNFFLLILLVPYIAGAWYRRTRRNRRSN